jgi:hypothetical protein
METGLWSEWCMMTGVDYVWDCLRAGVTWISVDFFSFFLKRFCLTIVMYYVYMFTFGNACPLSVDICLVP